MLELVNVKFDEIVLDGSVNEQLASSQKYENRVSKVPVSMADL